uniref:NAD(P)/FAD-dependent oxidoreductase n=1 Tax=Dictyoglomus thermophilum TaxID=14 RepID=A0A7C3RWA6_DICTH
MKYFIIGNGVSGITSAELIREKDKESEVIIISEEKYPYYARPQLIEFLAGNIKKEEIFFYTDDWYKSKKINVILGERVLRIDISKKEVETNKGKYNYDKLLIASGARPQIPPLENINVEGVFTLRTLDDALNILSYIKGKETAILLGCGLLGLETGRALYQRGLKIIGLEFFPRLLPRQLDDEGSKVLQSIIQSKFGFSFYLGVKAKKVLENNGKFVGIELEDGKIINGDLLIISAGIIPNVEFAKNSGIGVNKGIVVNDYMETSAEGIFAVGDCVEHQGRIYGIIPACLEQARVAVENMMGRKVEYKGTIPLNSLKVTGIDLTSIGEINPEGEVYEIKVNKNKEGFYRKLIFKDDKLVGAILLGDKRKYVNKVVTLIKNQEIVEDKEKLLYEE